MLRTIDNKVPAKIIIAKELLKVYFNALLACTTPYCDVFLPMVLKR